MMYIDILTGIYIIEYFIECHIIWIRTIYQDRDDQLLDKGPKIYIERLNSLRPRDAYMRR